MDITGTSRLTCLLGQPVAHSISPKMHNYSFQKLQLDYAYLAFDVAPEDIGNAVSSLRLFNARGFNLTMPHKVSVIPYLDEVTKAAALCNSVNTVVNDDGRLVGYTTDGIGYMDSLRDENIDITGQTMTLLGAGGAATSIIVQAALDGVKNINVFKRKNSSFDKTRDFCDMISKETDCKVCLIDIEDKKALKKSIDESIILTNATNVGMGDDDRSLVDKSFLRSDLIVSDIIYHPEMTRLLIDAKEAGAKYINGKYMLLYQGAAAFKLWTGCDMPVEYLKENCFS